MKDEEPKPGVVIDVTPDAQPEPQEEPASEPASPTDDDAPRRSGVLSLVVALLALGTVIAAGLFGYRHVTQLNADLAAFDAQLRNAGDAQQKLQNGTGMGIQS